MLEIPALIEPLFRAAGWLGPKEDASPDARHLSVSGIATRILDEFGGLTVGACGPGTEMAAGDVRFYEGIRPEVSALIQAWKRQIGEVIAFASAHHDHMILFVGANGSFYIFTDPDDQLYAGPHDFGELMRRMLWGYYYGPTIPRDIEPPTS